MRSGVTCNFGVEIFLVVYDRPVGIGLVTALSGLLQNRLGQRQLGWRL